MHRKSQAHIYINRLRSNLENLRSHSQCEKLCMMLKANAYGHGARSLAPKVQDLVDQFGVVSIEEAQEIREAGVRKPILLFANLWEDSYPHLVHWDITPVIGSFVSLRHFLAAGGDVGFHIKLNTGMNRFGFRLEEMEELRTQLVGHESKVLGLCSHLLAGGDYGQSGGHTEKQLKVWRSMLETLNLDRFKHFFKSAPLLMVSDTDPKVDFQGVRPGIACYGVKPDRAFELKWKLQPVMELKTVVSAIQNIKKGESVSYSASWIASRDSKIAVIQIGYADGLPRSLSNRLQVLIREKRWNQVGNICMDYCMVDITDLGEEIAPGEEVVIFGQQGASFQGVEELAEKAGTIPYEILTSVAPRVGRVYIE